MAGKVVGKVVEHGVEVRKQIQVVEVEKRIQVGLDKGFLEGLVAGYLAKKLSEVM